MKSTTAVAESCDWWDLLIADVRDLTYQKLDNISLMAMALTCKESNREIATERKKRRRLGQWHLWYEVSDLLDNGQDALVASIFSIATLVDSPGPIGRNGSIACLTRIRRERGEWPGGFIVEVLAGEGYLKALKFVHEVGGDGAGWSHDGREIFRAVRSGHLDVLKYLHENGCPWHRYTTWAAVHKDRLECLMYAFNHGCPWSADTLTAAALGQGNLSLLFAMAVAPARLSRPSLPSNPTGICPQYFSQYRAYT
jgi:hypothetical protein